MANVAYVRVSTVEQNDGRQKEALQRYQIDKWFIEKASGKDTKGRKQLQAMLDYVRADDTVCVESFSRLARNTQDLLNIVEQLQKKEVELHSLKENIDTSTPSGKLMLTMMAAIAQFERDCLLERQREGIALAKRKGKYKGRNKIAKPENWQELLKEYNTRKITATVLARKCKVSRALIYKWMHEQK